MIFSIYPLFLASWIKYLLFQISNWKNESVRKLIAVNIKCKRTFLSFISLIRDSKLVFFLDHRDKKVIREEQLHQNQTLIVEEGVKNRLIGGVFNIQ